MVHNNSNTCITIIEERFTALMKKMFAEELEKQHQSLLKLISGNFEITMKEIKIASNLQRTFLKKKFRIHRRKFIALKRKLMKYRLSNRSRRSRKRAYRS